MNLIRRSISAKLFLIAGTGTFIIIAAALFGFFLSWSSIRVFRDDVGQSYGNAFKILTMQADFKKQVQEWKDTLIRGNDPEALQKHWGNFEKQEKTVHDGMAELTTSIQDPEARKTAEQFLAAHQEMGQNYRKGLQAFKDAGFITSAGDVAVKGMDRKPTELLTTTAARLQQLATVSSAQAGKNGISGIVWSLVAIAVASLIAFMVFFAFIRTQITNPIQQLKRSLESLAAYDISVCIQQMSADEIGVISASAEQVRCSLNQIITQVNQAASAVSSSASELSSTAMEIATGTEEVAAQASSVATAGEEMTATSQDIAKSCQFAAEGAQLASRSAQEGAEVVDKTISVMGQIAEKVKESALTVENLGDRSDQIGVIVGTIEDIADQTNLLALNAAIEAARAGEQGRGFAVVADEVRALAERTTKATKEIGDMIKAIQQETKGAVAIMESSVQRVESGTTEAAGSGAALKDILDQVNAVAMQVNQIATAAEEQTATTGEISKNMQQITDVVTNAARGAHESALASRRLNGNAEELHRLVRQFKL